MDVSCQSGPAPPPSLGEEEVLEVPLLLPGPQLAALEKAAHHRGLTVAQMLRHILHEYLRRGAQSPIRPQRGGPFRHPKNRSEP